MTFRSIPCARRLIAPSYENMKAMGFYTINHIHKSVFKKAHQTSARYAEEISEFEAVQLTSEFSEIHLAPYVKESLIKISVKFEEEYHIKINDTILMIGSIIETFLPQDCLMNDGFIDIEKAGTVSISGLDSYHETVRLARLSYAKPGLPLTKI